MKPAQAYPATSYGVHILVRAFDRRDLIRDISTVLSTSTRNFPNRLGQGADVFLSSAELAAVTSILGRLPSVEEYMEYATQIDSMSADIYRYLNFDQMDSYVEAAERAKLVEVEFA